GMTACGGKEVETQEVDYDMTFENQTGIDVSVLEIRYAEDADWSEIALTDGEWKSGYPVMEAVLCLPVLYVLQKTWTSR
ncbi:MAG: hypothetical protein IIX57_06165, partial [Lachnospiraceae bacterium]|nr:hypothetical protein [Lachnospiraceae bacterium]